MATIKTGSEAVCIHSNWSGEGDCPHCAKRCPICIGKGVTPIVNPWVLPVDIKYINCIHCGGTGKVDANI